MVITEGKIVKRHFIAHIFITILIITLSSNTREAQAACPKRCSCYLYKTPSSVTCAKLGLTEFPENLSDLVQHLDMSVNMLEELPDTVALLSELEYLNLARNKLTALPNSFHNLEKLQRLDLSENAFTVISSLDSISYLKSLRTLWLGGNPLPSMEGLTSSSLRTLDFSHCGVTTFANDTLSGMPLLTILILVGNPLTLVQKPVGEMLRWLDLSDCQINYLTPDSLEYLPNLEELRLANNPRLVFSTRYDTLTHDKLKTLDASRCNLDRPGLHGLPQLVNAKLSRNLIRILPDQIFAKNRELQQLSLSGNGLDQLNKSAFAGLLNLEILDLSSNSLKNIHWTSFRENTNLKLLNLSYNSLLQFPNLTSSTNHLDLSSNLINDFDGKVLLNMPKLKTLSLDNNRVDEIPNQLESQSLIRLSLRQNRVIRLNNQSFEQLPALQTVDLSGNRLTEGPLHLIFSQNPSLHRIILEDNPWRCDCGHLRDTYEFLTEPLLKTNPQYLICQSPENVSRLTWEQACHDAWLEPVNTSREKAWGMLLISLLALVIVFGSIVSLRHAMKLKRQEHLERQELERAEARERLRLLQRRNETYRSRQEEELMEETSEPRINPLELIGPPTYEEAVHMPRLAHSMDALDSISVDSVPAHILGSVDNLRSKKRRPRRPRKRTLSDENLARREERRESRRRRASLERNMSANDLVDSVQSPVESNNEFASSKTLRRSRAKSISDDGGSRGRPRPLTPAARQKKRRGMAKNGHSSDDEDSDVQNGIVAGLPKSNNGVIIKTLTREPRSGYRPTAQESDF